MKVYRDIISVIALMLLSGCTSPVQRYTHIQQQIQVNQQKVNADGRALIAKAASLLQHSNKKDPNIKRALDILEKGEALIGTTIQDEQKFNNIDGTALTKAVDITYTDGTKLLEKIDNLEKQEDQAAAQMITNEIEQRAVNHYKMMQRIKWIAIISSVMAIFGAVCYFTPILSAMPFLASIANIFRLVFTRK